MRRTQREQPFVTAGQGAATQLSNLTGTNAGGNPLTAPLTAPFASTPGGQMAALGRHPGLSVHAGPGLASNAKLLAGSQPGGAALKSGINYAEGLASTTFQQQFQNYLTQNAQIAEYSAGPGHDGGERGGGVWRRSERTRAMPSAISRRGAGAASAAGTIGSGTAASNAVGSSTNALTNAIGLSAIGNLFGSGSAYSGVTGGVGHCPCRHYQHEGARVVPMNGNPLAAGAGPNPSSAGPSPDNTNVMSGAIAPDSPSPHPILAAAQSNLAGEQAKYDKLSKAKSSAEMVRNEMDQLLKLGDSVTADDVVEGLGKMVAGGLSPEPLIAMMAGGPNGEAPMPESGSGLASWLQQHEQKFAQFEQQIAQAHSTAAHDVGLAGVQGLVAHHIEAEKASQSPTSPPSSNPLCIEAPSCLLTPI